MTLNDAADYIILKITEEDGSSPLNLLKLQKLVYYAQAWYLAFNDKPLFNGRFQAWVHGPVSRDLYDRYKNNKNLYSEMRHSDIRDGFNPLSLPQEERMHIDTVLDVYAKYTGTQLEEMTHNEEPWVVSRQGYDPSERCEKEIDETLMASFYKRRTEYNPS